MIKYDANLYGTGKIKVNYQYAMLDDSTMEELSRQVTDYLSREVPAEPVEFDFSSTIVVINTAFDQLKALCRKCIDKGREVVFINPSPALSDFLQISEGLQYRISEA